MKNHSKKKQPYQLKDGVTYVGRRIPTAEDIAKIMTQDQRIPLVSLGIKPIIYTTIPANEKIKRWIELYNLPIISGD